VASLALGGIGYIIGSAIGGPVGGSIGYLIGSAIGTAFTKGNPGPQLEPPKLSGSSYGHAIPIIYATRRVPGEIIWAGIPVPHKTKQGKGSAGPETTTYTQSFAVLLADCSTGPMISVPKIWADSTVILDDSGDSGQLPTQPIVVYLGTDDQEIDPTMEAELGVGNTPAYRRYCYLMFNDYDLRPWGNRIPAITAQVVQNGGDIPVRISSFDPSPEIVSTNAVSATHWDGEELTVGEYDGFFSTYSENVFDMQGNILSSTLGLPLDGSPNQIFPLANLAAAQANGIWWAKDQQVTAISFNPIGGTTGRAACGGFYHGDVVYALCNNPGTGFVGVGAWHCPGGVFGVTSTEAYAAIDFGVADVLSNYVIGTTNNDNRCYIVRLVSSVLTLEEYDETLTLLRSFNLTGQAGNLVGGAGFYVFNDIFCCCQDGPILARAAAFRLEDNFSLTPLGTIAHGAGSIIGMGDEGTGYCITSDGIISLYPPAEPVTLAFIVGDISARVSCPSYDVAALESILVKGYAIDRQSTGRDNITPLQSAYFFDMVERAGTMTAVLRGGESMISIPQADLACHVYSPGSTDLPALIEITDTQELELPAQIAISYLDPDTDYQVGTQYARRQATTSQLTLTAQLAIVLTAQEAQAIAEASLYAAWVERFGLAIQVSREYWEYEPTDVVTAEGWLFAVRDKNDSVPGVVRFEGVASNRAVYNQGQAIGDPGQGFTPIVLNPFVPVEALLLDLPLLTGADSPNGFYAAFIPETDTPWPGARLYKSIDGGGSYTNIDASNIAAITGTIADATPGFSGGNTIDASTIVHVVLGAAGGELTSTDYDTLLSSYTTNLCLFGLEIGQYMTATLTAPGEYDLTNWLRGRFGTEWAIDAHGVNETFVALPTSANPVALFNELGSPSILYKTVTMGGVLADVTAQSFVNNGMALRPYSPVQASGGPIDPFDGTAQINWTRRTRIGGAWVNFNDVPLSEPSELYVVQIWNSTFTLVARIITGLTSPTYTYSAADQVTDFGATQLNIYATIGQLGSYSLGAQTQVIVPGLGGSDDAPLDPVPPYNSTAVPPSGGGGAVSDVLSWPSDPTVLIPFNIGDTWVGEFTASFVPTSGNVSAAEYGYPAYFRKMTICTDAAGLNVVAGPSWGNTVTILFPFAGMATATYYVIIQSILPDGTPSGVPGDPANMRLSISGVP
jgi:hypothetical protein